MAGVLTADNDYFTVDSDLITVDQDFSRPYLPGWPCANLDMVAPSVLDRQANASADDVLPQVLALAPRGPAWGTDEAGDGSGASPWMRRVWRAVAAWVSDNNVREHEVATQVFPSAISTSLAAWEAEYGLPDSCFSGAAGTASRIAAVRSRFGQVGGQSVAYLICLAASIGCRITIEEPTQFLVDVSECDGPGFSETYFLCDEGLCDTGDLAETWFRCDDGVCDADPLEGYVTALAGEGTRIEAFAGLGESAGGDEVAGGLIEEAFVCDDGVCDDTAIEAATPDPAGVIWKDWIVHVSGLGTTDFLCDEGRVDTDPLEGFLPALDLECAFRRQAPPHTQVVFSYAA